MVERVISEQRKDDNLSDSVSFNVDALQGEEPVFGPDQSVDYSSSQGILDQIHIFEVHATWYLL